MHLWPAPTPNWKGADRHAGVPSKKTYRRESTFHWFQTSLQSVCPLDLWLVILGAIFIFSLFLMHISLGADLAWMHIFHIHTHIYLTDYIPLFPQHPTFLLLSSPIHSESNGDSLCERLLSRSPRPVKWWWRSSRLLPISLYLCRFPLPLLPQPPQTPSSMLKPC